MTPIGAQVLADMHPSQRPLSLSAPVRLSDRIDIEFTALLMAAVGLAEVDS